MLRGAVEILGTGCHHPPVIGLKTGCSLLAVAAVGAILTGCGSSSTPTQATAKIDSCVVGHWKSTGFSGPLQMNLPPPVTIQLASGGAGVLLVINSDQSVSADYSAVSPASGSGTDGASWALTYSGNWTGRATAANGQGKFTFDRSSTAKQVTTRNGSDTVNTDYAAEDGSVSFSYGCVRGQALNLVVSGIAEAYSPAQ